MHFTTDCARAVMSIRLPLLGIMAVLAALAPDARAGTDTSPPAVPLGVRVQQGEAWQPTNSFDVDWDNPTDQSSIEVAHYELCPAVPLGPCVSHQEASSGISGATVMVPHAGWFWFRVWLEDAAGNVNPDLKSQAVMLRFDDQAPPLATIQHDDDGGWLNSAAPASPALRIQIGPGADWPLSGISGYSVSLDGSVPDAEIEVAAPQDYDRFSATYTLTGLPEGVTDIRVRSVSNTGIGSEGIGTSSLKVDRSPPRVTVETLPSSGDWHRNAVAIEMSGTDQAELSGMVAAAGDKPVENGAYLSYVIDGQVAQTFRGGTGALTVGSDGHHALTLQGLDVAGNPSDKKSLAFKIDQTAPTGMFGPLDSADPQRLVVRAFDATSGVEGGWIEYRRDGGGGFTRLPTSLVGDRMSARVDDSTLAPGRYEFRAIVRDVAGNQAVIARRADGSAMELGLPVREETRLDVGADGKPKVCPKRERRQATRKRRKPKSNAQVGCRTPKVRADDSTLEPAPGKRVKLLGRLTRGGNAPVASADVTVEGQLRSGGPFARIGTTRADAQGRVRFVLPPGPSRTVRFRYDGSATLRPSSAQVLTRVRAAVRLRVNRRRLLNGQSVQFRGELQGKPIPTGGKLVALQARVGRKWRTFATPRARANGVFKHRYRFTATTGLRRYAFRALVTREAAYSYETGVSRKVHVTVRGR
jgi:archaeosine-15-forming tRNA-guanine transglycosylase